MTELLEMKQRLKIFYGKYDVYLKPALKFLLALFAFFMINEQIGFMQKLSGPAVSLLLALLCSFLPVNMIAVFAGLLVCAHAYALSLEVFAMAAGLLAVMYILYFRVSPKYGYVLVLTPIAFLLKIPYAVPLTMGLLGGPACVVSVACGTVFYYLIYYMKNNEAMLASSEIEQMTSRLSYLVENVLNNKTVILTVLVFAVVLMIVYAIHRLSADHAWHIAIGAGAVTKSYLHREMDRGAKEAGVKRIRIHDLRHSHISLLIDMGFTALAIADRVGHESIDITYRYAHLFPTRQAEMADRLDMERKGV